MKTVTVSKEKFDQMRYEIKMLRNSALYKRLLEFEANIAKEKKYTREDLGF